MALFQAGQTIEIREINPENLPEMLLEHTDNAKIPLLVASTTKSLGDSLDIMTWALNQKDPEYWLAANKDEMIALINQHDKTFVSALECINHPEHFDETEQQWAQDLILQTLEEIEKRLDEQRYLLGAHISLADIALFPFILQFKAINKYSFDGLPYSRVHQWLAEISFHRAFDSVMAEFQLWTPGDPPVILAPWGRS